ncbi:ABC transporter ATP-binding protein [Mycoplasmopsis lipophila]|uniref:ABC transporter ATP-binding protein n=1 Tax=Mycoplasmopsis lipophila TaxID=2117 RepID=UPI003873682A
MENDEKILLENKNEEIEFLNSKKIKPKITIKNLFDVIEKNIKNKIFKVDRKIEKMLIKAAKHHRKADENKNLKNEESKIIEVKNVNKYYLDGQYVSRILENISFSLNKGEISMIFGKSGSGKSTLLNLISGLDRPSKGQVIVCDQNLPYLSDVQLTSFRRKNVSFIFQNYNLLTNLNGYDNVETGAYLQKDKSKKVNIEQLFERFEMKEVIDKYPSQMSGGQQQRISILRALAKNADIIFADEPTGALDENTTRIVLKYLYEANKEQGVTIVMVTHNPLLAPIADKVIHIENGVISKIINNEKTIHPDNLQLD